MWTKTRTYEVTRDSGLMTMLYLQNKVQIKNKSLEHQLNPKINVVAVRVFFYFTSSYHLYHFCLCILYKPQDYNNYKFELI